MSAQPQPQPRSAFIPAPRHRCHACNRRFVDWNELETHPCIPAEKMRVSVPTFTFSEVGWDRLSAPLEDDYSEESYP